MGRGDGCAHPAGSAHDRQPVIGKSLPSLRQPKQKGRAAHATRPWDTGKAEAYTS